MYLTYICNVLHICDDNVFNLVHLKYINIKYNQILIILTHINTSI